MSTRDGKYYVLEGVDYSGKSTQSRLWAEYLIARGRGVVEVYEPGSTPAGELMREILLHGAVELEPESEVDLFTVARRELVRRVIDPNIRSGLDVVSDRNWYSTIAFQGFGRIGFHGYSQEASIDYIVARSADAMGNYFRPDNAAVVDVSLDIVERRRGLAGSAVASDRFEREESEFQERVIKGYRWLAKEFDIPLIDGNQPVSAVHADIIKAFS